MMYSTDEIGAFQYKVHDSAARAATCRINGSRLFETKTPFAIPCFHPPEIQFIGLGRCITGLCSCPSTRPC